jgi:hypothetical protein
MRKFAWSQGLDFNNGSYRIQSTDIFSAPEVQISEEDLARADGVVQLYDKLGGRTINFGGIIRGSSQNDADNLIDNLKRKTLNLRSDTGVMAVDFPEGDRLWRGKITNLIIGRRNTDVSRATFSFQLRTPKPAADSALGLQPFITGGAKTVISSSNSYQVINAGSYLGKPVISLTVNSITTAVVGFSIGNPYTGQTVSFEALVKTGDAITIDCDQQKIFVNTQEVRAIGNFPAWLPDVGLMDYNDTTTSRNITIDGVYMPRYL